MAETRKEFGVVGLGRMGGNLALQAIEKGIRVVGFVRKEAPPVLEVILMVLTRQLFASAERDASATILLKKSDKYALPPP